MYKILMMLTLACIGFNAQAKEKKDYHVKYRANCACEYTSIDGKLLTRQRAYGLGSRAKAQLLAQKNCQKLAPTREHIAHAESCVYDRVKVDKNDNVIGMKRVLEEEAILASELESIL